jgi:hypothetical protein
MVFILPDGGSPAWLPRLPGGVLDGVCGSGVGGLLFSIEWAADPDPGSWSVRVVRVLRTPPTRYVEAGALFMLPVRPEVSAQWLARPEAT